MRLARRRRADVVANYTMKKKESHIKFLVRYYSEVLEKVVVETLWAREVDKEKGIYKVDSIPFYGPPFASDDLIEVKYDQDEKMLAFKEIVEYSGNSIIQVVLMNEGNEIEELREVFKSRGCISEKVNDRFFSMEIPSDKSYPEIKVMLDELKREGVIDYAEPVLSINHRK